MPISDIVDAVAAPYTVWRTLRGIEPLCCDGRPVYISGNASIIFQVKYQGRLKALKCYTRRHPYLKEIYGEIYYPQELYIPSIVGQHIWIDCLLYDYIDGVTLDEVLCRISDKQEFADLAASFDRMACRLLTEERKHGDLKPENIIVALDGEFHLIDFDASFVPSLANKPAVEVGTMAYQHPARTTTLFDEHIDDYSIAFISTLLHAAVLNPALFDKYSSTHEPPFTPRELISGHCDIINELIDRFARIGDAIHFRIARMLLTRWPRLFNLKSTMLYSQPDNLVDATPDAVLDQENGLWGCRNESGWIIPPLYDGGFDPTEGYMVVTLGDYTHLIRVVDRFIVSTFDKSVGIKPVANNKIVVCHHDGLRESVSIDDLLHNSSK